MIQNLINKILGDQNEKAIRKIRPLVEKINEIEKEYRDSIQDQNDVLAKTTEFKKRLKDGEKLEEILPEAFALVKTACRHLVDTSWEVRDNQTAWDMIPYDVQLIGGVVLHQGNIAEMKTGEGKTLVCTMPVYLNALTEKGVFVVTVNDYLAQRDAEWMGGLYNYLGLSVGVVINGMSHEEKKTAYNCDITYGTNNEFGFDYLRDNMVTDADNIVQRELFFAIIDEVDSILIDEARTPLIISAPADESTDKYRKYSRLVTQLKENEHYKIDEKMKTATLTEEGIGKMENLLGLKNIYTEAGFTEVHHIEQALRAQACYKADIDYVINEGEIVIIDEFTGRLMPGRRYSHGLHQAIEAKENVEVKRESKTLATVSFQNYFRLFEKIAGMTGTAATEAEEFYQIYGLETIMIPTNKPVSREDRSDSIYKNQRGKFAAVVNKIKELHQKGQPVLVGTISVEKSEILSELLKAAGIPHNVLNAKNHQREAEIVADAGRCAAVTIATNMAGRGTDIKLDQKAKEAGGLFVLGTERHESRRIDNQLRGRSGRQGDPGKSQFYVSMEDDLMRIFGGDRMKGMMEMLKFPEDMPIENRLISRSIESAQKKVEGHNFDIRKHLVEYDDVTNIHRKIIYKKRREFLTKDDLKDEIMEMIKEVAAGIVTNHTAEREPKDWNYEQIIEFIKAIYKRTGDLEGLEDLEKITSQSELIEKTGKYLLSGYSEREAILPEPSMMRSIEKGVFLRALDTLWMEHIEVMQELRQNVAFSGYAQKNPLNEYKSEAYRMLDELLINIKTNTVNTLFKMDLEHVILQTLTHRAEINRMQTNEDQVLKPLSGNGKSGAAGRQIQSSNNSRAGRNDPCPCGSGKKYKKCCGA